MYPRVVAARTFYRIIRGNVPTVDDFKSAKELGKPLRDVTLRRQWAEGLSVYDNLDHAKRRTRYYRFLIGRHVVALQIDGDTGIEVEQTGADPHHFTIYGAAEDLLALAADLPIHVDQE